MKLLLFCLTLLSTSFASPKPVDYVDHMKFSGLWYEIARTYNAPEKDCVASTVEYIPDGELKYDVYNRCFEHTFDGELTEYSGSVTSLDDTSMAKLKMRYYLFFTRKYKIIYIDPNYTTAIMVDDALKHVWIMHRNPTMPKEHLNLMVDYLSKYMDTSTLIYTPQHPKGKYK